ncbi:virion structural protein [Vibrio phage vB_pir03]|nr:virion structural protein [Vibrio phage vB_pir03]
MYILNRSYVFDSFFGSWDRKDLSLYKISEIMKFPDFKLILSLQTEPDKEFVVMKEALLEYNNDFTGRFALAVWLSEFTEDRLRRSDRPTNLRNVKHVWARELFRTGACVHNARIQGEDLELQSSRVGAQVYAPAYMYKNCLMAINRRVFRISKLLNKYFIYHAGDWLRDQPDYSVGIIDFQQLGGIETFDIVPEMVTEITTETDKLNRRIRISIKLPEEVTGKTPFVVTDGHLSILDGSIFQANADTFVVTYDKKRLVENALIDKDIGERLPYMSSANISEGGARIDTLDIVKLVTNNRSFFGFVNHADLLVKFEDIPVSSKGTSYTHYRIPKGICYFDNGEMAQPTVFNYNQHHATLTVHDSIRKEWMHDTSDWTETKAKSKSGKGGKLSFRNLYIKDIYYF